RHTEAEGPAAERPAMGLGGRAEKQPCLRAGGNPRSLLRAAPKMSYMPTDADFQRIKDQIFAGNQVGAVKAYRKAMGVDLTEAKAAVEEMTAELRESEPESFRAAKSKGCSAGAAALL